MVGVIARAGSHPIDGKPSSSRCGIAVPQEDAAESVSRRCRRQLCDGLKRLRAPLLCACNARYWCAIGAVSRPGVFASFAPESSATRVVY
uniref:Predicted protein n=1 Tax=Hordeum vulgare subsp. vulgare TaxID=112509 RepID=F2D6F8_HORVV|nr:predicted protein [Hordeum vulgare subsp. vulgare]